nr:triple QxxK/R motif-containing protein isoform X3 [Chrysemys picta bellii]XP_042701062.1 triple QxxK/R motif-containing protein isoform X3 [Chrysemys picta bellii]XP_042701063.1 triple QxxK/R motif-containing protein isoform X3 [Chrysemys picta bellii]XP_042701064.1 triple QxxK/R motif-containing protein isoform X3 [Chrysemys picta bellii]XP_042701065.1 triple QxxK/R motif-containing protein isoform X3 [Chrysemys picta bellii]
MGHSFCEGKQTPPSTLDGGVVLDSKRMGRKDASAARIPVEQYRKQIGPQGLSFSCQSNQTFSSLLPPLTSPLRWSRGKGGMEYIHLEPDCGNPNYIGKQDYKKSRPVLRATRLKAEAKKTALGIKEVALVLAAILVLLLAFYAFFYLNLSSEVDLDLDPNEN